MEKEIAKQILNDLIDRHNVESLSIVSLPDESEPIEGCKTYTPGNAISVNLQLSGSGEVEPEYDYKTL